MAYASDQSRFVSIFGENRDIDICDSVAIQFFNYCQDEIKSDTGLQDFVKTGTLMYPGYTETSVQRFSSLKTELSKQLNGLEDKNSLVYREISLVLSIVDNYLDLLAYNQKYRRLSLFMPPNLVDPQDAIDAIGFVFGNLNSLFIKGKSPDIIAKRFEFYVTPGLNTPGFVDGAIAELENLIAQYSEHGGQIIYPSVHQLDDMIHPEKLDAIIKELPALVGAGQTDLIAEFTKQIRRYVDFVNNKLRPYAPRESMLPSDIYITYLRLYGVNDSPEQLVERAKKDWNIYYKRYKDLAQEIAKERGLDETDPARLTLLLEHETSSSDPTLIMERYVYAQNQVEEWIQRDNLMTLPGQPIRIRTSTPAEEATFPVPHVIAPNFINNEGDVWPEFVLCSLTENSSPITAYPLIVHEGRPGHDLQFSRMLELYLDNKLNLIETVIASNSANVEGWAHYVEYLMIDYMPKEAQLTALKDQLLRIGRMFLDPQLNNREIKFDDIVHFMKNKIGFESMALSEAKRYSFLMPGQATSYRYGAIKIMDLRDQLQKQMGDQFSLCKFHDAILSFGLLPVDLYADLIAGRMALV